MQLEMKEIFVGRRKLRKWIEEEEKREGRKYLLAKAFDQVREIITRQPHSYIINIFLFVCLCFVW